MGKGAAIGVGIFVLLILVGGLFYYSYTQLSVELNSASLHSIDWRSFSWSTLLSLGLNALSGNWLNAAFDLVDGINVNLGFALYNDVVYKKEWKGIGDWLGTGSIAHQNKKFRPFKEAREFAHSLKFPSSVKWREYCKSDKRPKDIPTNPDSTYMNDWINYPDWLGIESSTWSVSKIKELLKGLIDSGIAKIKSS